MIACGHGVTLYPLDEDYIESFRRVRNHPAIRRWCRQVGLISREDQKKWFKNQQSDPTIQMFQIYNRIERVSGVCGLTSIDLVNARAEFSLYIFPTDHRQGLGRGALKTLLDYGFKELNLHQIWGETFDGNPAMRLFTDLGFKKDGTLRDFYFKNGEYIDAHRISILRSEWLI